MAREKASANELSGKLHTTEKDLNFKIKVSRAVGTSQGLKSSLDIPKIARMGEQKRG